MDVSWIRDQLPRRWREPCGYREVLKLSLPLVASMSSTTVMHFTDRVFLGVYSVKTLAASVPASITYFMFISFFLGVCGILNTFIAQYIGAGARMRVGASLWQAIYFSLASWFLLSGLLWLAEPIFKMVGHPEEVRALEVVYFRILVVGSVFVLLGMTFSCFFSGRGRTGVVMIVNLIGAAVNIPLDYALINGIDPFPEMGIRGAGVATVTASAVMCAIYGGLIFTRGNQSSYSVFSCRCFEVDLFARLMRYGVPNGIQFFVDIFAFTLFLFIVGRLGTLELAVTNIGFSISTLTFMPMTGFAMATSILVGQSLGGGDPQRAKRATSNALHLTLLYMIVMATLFISFPGWFVDLFRSRDYTPAQYEAIQSMGRVILRFIAFFCLFDSLNLIYSGALKGAGDTAFVMKAISVLSISIMVLPTYIGVVHMGADLYMAWGFATLYLCVLAVVFYWRYGQGKWMDMVVIEPQARPA
jgi:MATE family multidrug resistance protein